MGNNLQGKTAVVTGAGRGIGREVALLMAKEGASVVVNDPGGDRSGAGSDRSVADGVVAEIAAAGGRASANYNSVTDYNQAAQIVKQCVDSYGKMDCVVNVAGFLRERMIWNMSEDDWDAVITVHLKGHWNMCHHASRVMRGQRSGRIVNFSSDAFKGSVGQCNYSAAKGGIISLTRSLAKELGRFGVTANAICPLAATRMTMNDKVIEGMRQHHGDAGARVHRTDGRLPGHRCSEGREQPGVPRREGQDQYLRRTGGGARAVQVRQRRHVLGR